MSDTPTPKIKDALTKPLPKRFYREAIAVARDGLLTIELDGRAAKTPLKRPLAAASRPLAEAIAAEWVAQSAQIDPATMPLTRLVTTAIDAVVGKEAAVAAEIVAYAGSDLICYRAEAPDGLVAAQARHWDPILAWAFREFSVRFVSTAGLMHVTQPTAATTAIAKAVEPLPALRLAALHVLMTLSGSALLALAYERRVLDLDAFWTAAHVDEDWQVKQWGEDFEAAARRARRFADAKAAAFVLDQA